MLKKLAAIVLSTTLLTACMGSGEDENVNVGGKQIYETEEFTIAVPQDWEILDRDDFTSNVPASAVVAFRNNIKSEIFTANLNISAGTVPEDIDSLDMAKSVKENAKNSLIGFETDDDENYTFKHGDAEIPTVIVSYQGRENASGPIIHFKQLHVVSEGMGYALTGAYAEGDDESVVNMIDGMLDSFALK